MSTNLYNFAMDVRSKGSNCGVEGFFLVTSLLLSAQPKILKAVVLELMSEMVN